MRLFVLLPEELNITLRISPGAGKFLLGVGQPILIELQFRLGKLEPLLKLVLLAPIGVGGAGGEFFHALLGRFDFCFRFPDTLLQGFDRGSLRCSESAGIPQGAGKCQVNLSVGQLDSLLRELLFQRRGGQRRKGPRRVEELLVNRRLLPHCRDGHLLIAHGGGM